jgi:hypothetical protein
MKCKLIQSISVNFSECKRVYREIENENTSVSTRIQANKSKRLSPTMAVRRKDKDEEAMVGVKEGRRIGKKEK